MKSFNLLLVFFISAVLISCGDRQTPDTSNKDTTSVNEQTKKTDEHASRDDSKDEHHSSDGIRVTFPVGSTEVSVNGEISGLGEQKIYVMEVKEGQKLNASVKPADGDGNIRISQIISPTGEADGPFGPSVTYDLNASGDWKIVLSENQMAGDAWKGEYILTIDIK